MASADVEKLAVYDSRIVQTRPKFAVEKGALSVTNAPFQALSQSTSQHTYSVQVPSETTFVDRAVNWSAQVGVALTFNLGLVTCAASGPATYQFGRGMGTAPALGSPGSFAGQGAAWGWTAFPLQSLTSTIQATINDTNVTINTSDVLKEILRLVDIRANSLQRTTPTKLDTYASAVVDSGYINSTYGSYINAAPVQEEVPNSASWTSGSSAFAPSPYVTSAGAPVAVDSDIALGGASWVWSPGTLGGSGTIASATLRFASDGSLRLILTSAGGTPTLTGASFTVYVAPYFTEKLVLSPFVFSDIHERDTGLFGIQNIQWVMNMRNPQDCRLVRQRETVPSASAGSLPSYTIASSYATQMFQTGAFAQSHLDMLFLTPSLDLPLPPKSVVPYMEFPRYITTGNAQIGASTSGVVSTQTITLPQIPDFLVVYAKPQTYADSTQGDWYLPISNVSLQWDNFAGLMSTYSQQQLYEVSVENGLTQDYQQWSGRLPAGLSTEQGAALGSIAQSVGGFLVLKPGKDYALQTGQAPSLVGNYTLQLNLTLNNFSASAVTPVIYVMTINSGFFESVKGTSRVVKGILSEADIIDAPLASIPTRSAVARAVGAGARGGIFKHLGHAIQKALPHLPAVAKALAPIVKPMLPGAAQSAMSAMGMGMPSHSGGRRSVAKRLM